MPHIYLRHIYVQFQPQLACRLSKTSFNVKYGADNFWLFTMYHYRRFKGLSPLFPNATMLQTSQNRYNSTLRQSLSLNNILLDANLKIEDFEPLSVYPFSLFRGFLISIKKR